jgi:hypothetical protein
MHNNQKSANKLTRQAMPIDISFSQAGDIHTPSPAASGTRNFYAETNPKAKRLFTAKARTAFRIRECLRTMPVRHTPLAANNCGIALQPENRLYFHFT